MLDLIHKIVKKTVGYKLVGTKPMSDEEYKKWSEENDKKRKRWEETHPEQMVALRSWLEKYESKKPYVLSQEEREIVKELLNIDDDYLDMMDIYIFDDGDICVRTPQVSWMNLCGREWTIDLEKKKVSLTSMN
jgi:hypothetical protein